MSTSIGAVDMSPETSHTMLSTQDSHDPEVPENEDGVDQDEADQNVGLKIKVKFDEWNDFSLVTIDGVRKAKCLLCSTDYTMSPGNPTTSLKRHSRRCVPRLASLRLAQGNVPKQTVLCFNSVPEGGNLTTYKYDKEKVRDLLAKMIIVHEYSFRMVEHELFNLFCKLLNPLYEEVSRQVIRDRCVNVYAIEKKKLKNSLLSISRVSLTSDLWTSSQTVGYKLLTAHYLDSDWNLQKRVLSFCCFPPPHTGVNIADMILKFLAYWGIGDKVSTITMDNASSNDVAVRNMKHQFAIKGNLYFRGKIFHVRCGAHILNLMVHDGIDSIKVVIEKLRESVKYVTLTPLRLSKFNDIVKDLHLPTNKSLILDIRTRWNSTCYMLNRALIFKDAFPLYRDRDPLYSSMTDDEERQRAFEICQFLEIFEETTKLFSGISYSISNLFFPEVWKIRKILDDKSSDVRPFMKPLVFNMRDKFDKYWNELNLLMAVGDAIDPRNKLKYLEYVFHKLYDPKTYPGKDGAKPKYLEEVDRVKTSLYELYEAYIPLMNGGEDGNVGCSTSTGLDKIKEKDKDRSNFESWAKEMNIAQPSRNELDVYLEEGIYFSDSHFDALNWWKSISLKFPNLSQMASDILAIPITTVASESTFSAAGRVIDDHRASMISETAEALICSADWLRHEFGITGKRKK